MNHKLKVQLLCAKDMDACSLYRGYGPFNRMHKLDQLEVVEREAMGWRYSSCVDVFFVQRPHNDVHVDAIIRARDNGIKVVVDFDDDFSTVPLYNPAWMQMRGNDHYLRNILKALEAADEVWVSTQALKEQLISSSSKLDASKFRVVANGWNWDEWKCVAEVGDENKFFWRGTGSHDKDLWQMTAAIIDAIKMAGATGDIAGVERGSRGDDNLDYVISTMGVPFWMSIESFIDVGIKVDYNLSAPFHGMMRTMRSSRAKFGLVPLVDNIFNNCKSNIAALEMLASGMLPITAARAEFKLIPGIVCGDNYRAMLAGAMDMSDEDRVRRWVQAVEWMESECRLDDRNKERMQYMLELVE